MTDKDPNEGKKAAVNTFIEQTKLLVTLSSAFLIAPAAFASLFMERAKNGMNDAAMDLFIASEALFVGSVLAGYVVLATIAGYQHLEKYNVYRCATVVASLVQIGAYLIGMGLFGWMVYVMIQTPMPSAAT